MAHSEIKQHLANWHTGKLEGADSTNIRTFTQSQFQVYFTHHYVWFTGSKDTESMESRMMGNATSYNSLPPGSSIISNENLLLLQ